LPYFTLIDGAFAVHEDPLGMLLKRRIAECL
jgi:hypothetical protein